MFFDQVTHILEQKHYICQKGPIDFELNSYPTHIRTYDVNQKIKEKWPYETYTNKHVLGTDTNNVISKAISNNGSKAFLKILLFIGERGHLQ